MNNLQLLLTELRLQKRYGIFYAALFVILGGALTLYFLPETARRTLLPILFLVDTTVFGLYLMPGMIFLEKSDRVLSAIVTTPLSTQRYLVAKIIPLTAIVIAVSFVLALILLGGGVNWALLALGMTIGSVMTMLAGFVLASRFETITQYLVPSIVIMVLVQIPAFGYFGLWSDSWLKILPTTMPLILVTSAFLEPDPLELCFAILYGAATCGVLFVVAKRSFERFVVSGFNPRKPKSRKAPRQRIWKRRGSLHGLLLTDIRSVGRDPILLFMAGYAVFLSAVGRWLIPWIVDETAETFDLTPYIPLIVTFFTVQCGPLVLGPLAGLLLLDERDERSLLALRTTPLSMTRYTFYRAGIPALLSVALCFSGVWFVGLVDVSWPRLLVVAILVGAETPMFALLLAGFASNKVEGLAVAKALGLLALPGVLGWFLDPPVRWLLGIVPTLWPADVLWQAIDPGQGHFWFSATAGLVTHTIVLYALLRRFRSSLEKS